jgi:steroid delta-isomerase-like uncharacterized protein
MRRVVTTAALITLIAGCGATSNRAEVMAAQLMEMWRTGNTSTLETIAATDVVYDDVPNGQRFEGREGVRQYIGHVHAWASEIEIEITSLRGDENEASAEWIMRGIQDRPIPGRVPIATHRHFRLNGVTLVELRDGKIARAADYLDALGFVVQLGGRVELPGGGIIQSGAEAPPQAGT